MRSILLLFLGFFFFLQANAQRFFFENIGVQNGLPASKVYDVLQDRTGMIWIATEAGVSRFDGGQVVTFGTGNGMAPNGARCLFLDDRDRIWVGHLGGGITLIANGSSTALRSETAITSDVNGIEQDAQGRIWITTYGQGALRIDSVHNDGSFEARSFGLDQGLDPALSQVRHFSDGTLCFVDAAGSLYHLIADDRFEAYMPKGLPPEERVITVFEASNGSRWFGTRHGGAYELDGNGLKSRYYLATGLASNFIISFGEDAQGNVWIGTFDRGIGRVQQNGIQHFNTSNGLHDNMVRCIMRDREGNMLLGTNVNGLEIFKGERFINFTENDGLVDPQVWAVMEDRHGRIWFGTNGGITLWDPGEGSTGRVKNITSQQGELNSNRVRCLKEDVKGKVWIGTDNAGLFEFDPFTFRSGFNPEVRVFDGRVTALETGSPGELWVGSIDGLIRHIPGTVPEIYHTNNGLPGANIAALYRSPTGTIWVGTVLNGIARIDNGMVKAIDLGRAFTATCFVQDDEGRMWVGTEGQGVLILKDDQLAGSYSTEDGLLSNTIKALNIDPNGHVWIGSTRGLNKWIPGRDGFISYTERSGYTGIETKAGATCLSRSGHLWFGTANGATRILPDRKEEQLPPPLIALRGLRVNLEDRPLEAGMKFGHADHNIRIAYGSVSLSDPAAVQYAYMLDGVDDEWQPPTNSTEANYPALQPGTYVFKVKAMDRSGQWSEEAAFNFTILPPWYRSWWFYSVLVAALAIILFSYIKVREKQLRSRNILLERKVQERTAEVVAQSREIEGQKAEIEGLLLNILPREISEELKENGKATARRHEEVTVLFTDMKGFTRTAEKMTPEELVHELDECFIRFDEITARYGIEKIKTIGDSYMCACGVPTKVDQHAVRSVLAAMEVRELMDEWRREREAKGKEPWILRIGIHSGPVVAGVVGRRKFAYDIWGDTVNTASRMESSGMPGEVNVSGTTYSLVKDFFECEHRGQVEAKNKGKIDMYFVRRLKPEYSADDTGNHPNARLREAIGLAETMEELA